MNKHQKKLLVRLNQAAPLLVAISEELSFTKAAERLNVQQSAVSHRVRALEQSLGVTLFERTTRKLKHTEAGLIVCQAATTSLAIWPQALDKLASLHTAEQIKLSLPSSLAMKWLIPILGHADSRGLDISLNVSDEHVNFDHENIDAAIRFGIGPYPGLHSVRLSHCKLQPVASPNVISTIGQDIDSFVINDEVSLLADHTGEADNTSFDWQSYLTGIGLNDDSLTNISYQFGRADLMLQAAINGLGIGLGRTLLIEQDLESGFLKKMGPSVKIKAGYWLVCKPSFAETKRYEKIYGWLKEEIHHTLAPSENK